MLSIELPVLENQELFLCRNLAIIVNEIFFYCFLFFNFGYDIGTAVSGGHRSLSL